MGNFHTHCPPLVLEPGNRSGVGAWQTLAGRGRSGSRLAGGSTGDALPKGTLSMSRALRPDAEAAGRCACALRAHTICALSQCAVLWRAGCERLQRRGNGAERRPKSAGGHWVCERPNRGAGTTSAAVTRWGRGRKTRAKTGSQWLGSHGGGRRGSVDRAGPAGAGQTEVEARGQSCGAPSLSPEWVARGRDPSSGRGRTASATGWFFQLRLSPTATPRPAWKRGRLRPEEWGSGFGVPALWGGTPNVVRATGCCFCDATLWLGSGRVLFMPLYL